MTTPPRGMFCAARHWFSRSVGERQPTCVRCGAPNPRWCDSCEYERDHPKGKCPRDMPACPIHDCARRGPHDTHLDGYGGLV